jgi:hypothetical protein
LNPAIIITIGGVLVAAASGFLIERQKRVQRFNYSVKKTIDSITEEERNCKVAVFEDFPEHERLFMELLPYLLFFGRRRTQIAWENYIGWYKTINQAQKQSALNILGADHQSEINTTIQHLVGLLKTR